MEDSLARQSGEEAPGTAGASALQEAAAAAPGSPSAASSPVEDGASPPKKRNVGQLAAKVAQGGPAPSQGPAEEGVGAPGVTGRPQGLEQLPADAFAGEDESVPYWDPAADPAPDVDAFEGAPEFAVSLEMPVSGSTAADMRAAVEHAVAGAEALPQYLQQPCAG